MNSNLIHVIVPAYGRSPYLKETLLSIVSNVPSDIPITVLDDCSPSNEIQEIVDEFSNRIKYKKNSYRLGIAKNFNEALKISSGRFTMICGSDDKIKNSFKNITNIIAGIEFDKELAGVIFDAKVINENNNLHQKITDLVKWLLKPKLLKNFKKFEPNEFLKTIAVGDWVYFPSILWNTDVVKDFQFDENYKSAMDLKMFYDLSVANKYFIYAKEKFIEYRRHSDSASYLNFDEDRRFNEEIKCHQVMFKYAALNEDKILAFLTKLAISVRLNAIIKTLISKEKTFIKLRKVRFFLRHF